VIKTENGDDEAEPMRRIKTEKVVDGVVILDDSSDDEMYAKPPTPTPARKDGQPPQPQPQQKKKEQFRVVAFF
jgi:hypothetical protein